MLFITMTHAALAILATITGAFVLARRKGDISHTTLGKIFVISMILVNLSAFSFWPKYGFTFFQVLALWNLIWVLLGYYYAYKKPNNNWLVNHYYYISYAYLGVLAATVARLPVTLEFAPTESALISLVVVFGFGAYYIEKIGKKVREYRLSLR
ncbi:DUF2306 domain-containing protein [Thalassotalea litorea]|uniref:DUF2306 domain-containing protein n=1 Tax=Thalassotalea litorea TaxID=2020715 RepID=UPI003735592C